MAGNTGASRRGAASTRSARKGDSEVPTPGHVPSPGRLEVHTSPRHGSTVTAEASEPGRRQLEALFAHSLDSILLANDEATFTEANPAACELSGYSREELFTKKVWDLTPPDDLAAIREWWSDFLETGEFSGEFTLLRSVSRRRLTLDLMPAVRRAGRHERPSRGA